MKILFANSAPLIKYGLAMGVEQLGHEAIITQLFTLSPQEQAVKLLSLVEEHNPDAIFCEGHIGVDMGTYEKTIKEINKTKNIPHIYWAIEDPTTHSIAKFYSQFSDYVFTTTQECLPLYKEYGVPAEVMLFGVNPDFHKRVKPDFDKYDYDLVLVASNYDCRYDEARYLVMPFVEMGYKIKIWGWWWDDGNRPVNLNKYPGIYGGMLPYEELPTCYSTARIVLGMNCDDTSVTQTSMRVYEVLGCGAFYLTHHTKAHEALFKNKEHLTWAKNINEALSIADYYLSHPEEREVIALAGQKEVYEKHNYKLRAQQLINVISKVRD